MARGGPRECFLAREEKMFHLHPPPRSRGPISGRTRTSGLSIGPPRFFDLFLARGQNYLRSTGLAYRIKSVTDRSFTLCF